MKAIKTQIVIPEEIRYSYILEKTTYECEKCDFKSDSEYDMLDHELYLHSVEKVIPLPGQFYSKLYYFESEEKANCWMSEAYHHRYHEDRQYGYPKFWQGPGWYVSFNDSDLSSVGETIKSTKERIEFDGKFLAAIEQALKENK